MSTSIRRAEPSDVEAVTALLGDLGYQQTLGNVRRTLAMSSEADPVYVATDDGAVIGMLSLQITRWIQLEKPIARIPAMIVSANYQRRGIGRQLIMHALAHARRLGCGTIELTSGNEREDAHAFYRDMGFEQNSLRFKRTL